jgi:putative cardiolipin synthase
VLAKAGGRQPGATAHWGFVLLILDNGAAFPAFSGEMPWLLRRPILAAALGLLLAGCAGAVDPPGPPHRSESHALADPETTALGRVFEPEARSHGGLSGFDLINSGETAFEARYAFARLAQRTIDAQYFIWASDETGRNMLAAMIAAADRGVRVRLLLDDLNIAGEDETFAILTAHPNIKVRVFNPFVDRGFHLADYLLDFDRVNHRMHNKAFIVDNAIAVVGGRNIANPYFAADQDANFRDLDLFAAGAVVREVSENFDAFWNSPWAISIHRVTGEAKAAADLTDFVDRLHQQIGSEPYPFRTDLPEPYLEALVESVRKRLVWAKASLFADRPDKAQTGEPELLQELRAAVAGTIHNEVLIESAYFVPSDHGTDRYCALVKRGVRVRVLTNSLASTDEVAVYAGFMRHRADLLACGVELHELRPDAAFIRRSAPWLSTRSEAELHTKAAVFDRAQVMIGSFNLDPRSRRLNTEMAILVESPDLAGKVGRFIDNGMALANAFRLEIDEDGDTVWVGETDGHVLRFHSAPQADLWRRLQADLLSLLPIEDLL